MKVRRADISDLDVIIDINKLVDYENPDEFIEESIEKQRIYVLVKKHTVVGFLLYQFIWGNAPFLSLIKIHTNYQKQGGGSFLIDEFEKYLSQEGYENYYSSTGEENTGSQVFHEKLGFREVGRLKMKFGYEIYFGKDL